MNTRLVLKILLCTFLTTPLYVGAVSLALEPAFLTRSTGETVTAKLRISELGNFAPPSLGAFAIEFSYNPAVLSFSSASYSFSLGNPDPAALEADTLTTVGPGTVRLEQISFLSPAELSALQPDAFSLANVEFLAIAPGVSFLTFTFVDLADAEFPASSLIPSSELGSVVTVEGGAPPSGVPSPGTGALLIFGIIILSSFRLRVDSTPKRKHAASAYESRPLFRVAEKWNFRSLLAKTLGATSLFFAVQSNADVYQVIPVAPGIGERSSPSINDAGDIVWSERDGAGVWQILKNGSAITTGSDDKRYPSISNSGSIVYVQYGPPGGALGVNRQVVLHPSTILEFSSRDPRSGSHRDAGEHPDIGAFGEVVWYYDFFNAFTGTTVRRLNSSVLGRIDDNFLGKDFPSCLGHCAFGRIYSVPASNLITAGPGTSINLDGKSPRASTYGVIYTDIMNELGVYSFSNDSTSRAYGLNPGASAIVEPKAIASPSGDINVKGSIVFESETPRGGIYLGNRKAGWDTTVAISAGHGRFYHAMVGSANGYQRGKAPPSDVIEDVSNLGIARFAQEYLSHYGVSSVLVREGDWAPGQCFTPATASKGCKVDQKLRVDIARAAGAKAYIAVHTDGGSPTRHGAYMARQESITPMRESKMLEDLVMAALTERGVVRKNALHPYSRPLGEYKLAIGSGFKVAYLEAAFHTNTVPGPGQSALDLENTLLATDEFRRRVGEAIGRGAIGFFVDR